MGRALLLCAALAALAGPARPAEVFRGESCARCHAGIRDASDEQRLAPAVPGEPDRGPRDVVVVGGGLSGLAAAYALRDRDVLVLEKEAAAGGKVRRESWGRARYPVAAGYMSQVYLDQIAKLFRELKISAGPIPEPGNAFWVAPGRVALDPFGKGIGRLDEPADVKAALRTLRKDMGRLSNDPQIGDVPPVPGAARMTALQRELDKRSFYDYMKGRYGARVAQFSDRYSRSLFGVGARDVSAWTGVVFFAADFGDSANITWDGGPGLITERLASALGPKLLTGALVTAVTPSADGVVVEYERGGKRFQTRAKEAVIAIPGFVAKHVVSGLPDWKTQALARLRYSAYAVAIVALDRELYHQSFDLWSDSQTVFTDLEPLDWGRTPGHGPGTPAQILEAFMPMGEDEGRSELLDATDAQLEDRVASGLEHLFPGARAALHGIRVIRWGHAMPIDYPGYLSGPRGDVAKPVGRLVFAGVDSQMPCIEGAIVSGLDAARQARRALGLAP